MLFPWSLKRGFMLIIDASSCCLFYFFVQYLCCLWVNERVNERDELKWVSEKESFLQRVNFSASFLLQLLTHCLHFFHHICCCVFPSILFLIWNILWPISSFLLFWSKIFVPVLRRETLFYSWQSDKVSYYLYNFNISLVFISAYI